MINKYQLRPVLLYCLLCCTLSSCIAVKYHDYAALNKDIALEIIRSLKSDTLLIVVPTFQQKEILLKNISGKRGIKNEKNKLKLLNLYAERQIQQKALIASFLNNYTFSAMLFIPDSLINKFEAGIDGHYFINKHAEIDSSIHYANNKPIKLIQQFDQEWQIKIGNQMIPNPFPNYYVYRNGLYGFLGDETYDKMYARVASVFQKRFEQFYLNPDRRIYL